MHIQRADGHLYRHHNSDPVGSCLRRPDRGLDKRISRNSSFKHRSDMADRPSRRWIPVASTMALAAVLLIAAILILPIPGKTTTTTGATATIATSLQTTSAALSTTGATTTTSVTSLQTSLTTLTKSDYNSSLGIELSMSIAGSALSENDGVSLYLSLDNTLATRNNLTRPGGRDLPLSSYQTCSQLPVGVEIFQGNYDVGNASQGEPLGLIGSNEVVHCAVMPDSWSLAPMSNHITYPTGPAAPASMNMTYWGNWSNSGQVFRPFSLGAYTIEGLDFWGQATILHFQVVENQNPLDCATIASNSWFAAYTTARPAQVISSSMHTTGIRGLTTRLYLR